ncbi:flagellin lysine-N-methylase [Azotosporobacter soli]|uniref:flagellin lysine-N-methylase n=1 Tax=Azotosporobacter soli TaxID=3055040 RepID=UPI0031FE49C2
MYIFLDIVEDFQCEMCGRCCRNDWLVTVNEASYLRNERLFAERDAQNEFSAAFQKISGERCPGEYAYIAKKKTGGCWFLEADNRCSLHRQIGHQHLDSVCQTFPRYPISSTRGMEFTLTFNCPAVQKRLNRAKPLLVLRSEHAPLQIAEDSIVAYVYPEQKGKNDPLHYYFELEQHFIDLLQVRGVDLDCRLLRIKESIARLRKNGTNKAMGEMIRETIYGNYEWLDENETMMPGEILTADILQEHFLVNLVFQKVFYLYGLEEGLKLLLHFRQVMQRSEEAVHQAEAKLEAVRAAVMELSFQHSHNRQLLRQE